MKTKILPFRLWIMMFLIGMLSISRLNAQLTVDTTGTFDPPLSNIHIVYAEVIYNLVDGTNIDCGFALSAMELSDWGHYATNIAFYEAGLAVRNQAVNGFVRTNVINVVPGQLIKLWIVINVPAQTYRAYAQTGDMTEPLIIYDGDATFRNTDVGSGLNRWTAFHNRANNNHYLTVNTVTLETNSDPTLKSLTSSVGALEPVFSPDILDYNLDVPFGTTSIQLNADPNGMGAVVNMFDGLGNPISGGLVSFSGDGVDVEIIVTALDGTQLSYYVAIFVGEGKSDARLKDIEVSVSALDPLFDPDKTAYTLVVPVGTTSVNITGVPFYDQATVTGGGTVNLSGGAGTASLVVTSADGSATNTYTVSVVEADGNNYALSLPGANGNNSNVKLTGLELSAFPYTIEMWFKPEGTQPYNAGLLYHRPHNIGIEYVSEWQTPRDRVRFMTGVPDNYGTTSDLITPDVWHHVAAILTDRTRTVYLDGVLSNTEAIESPVLDYSIPDLYLGWDNGLNSRAFKGLIDEVRIWSDSLTAEELKANQLAVLTGDEPNLMGYWNFDLNASSVAIDLSGGKLHGPITGGTYVPSFSRLNLDLDTLYVEGFKMKPGFMPKRTDYYITLPIGTGTITINATADDGTATVTGTGSKSVTEPYGVFTVTVTSAGGEESNDYTIHYVVETDLTLKNSYTFADGTAKDVVGGSDGDVRGGAITEGVFTSSAEGDYIVLPGEEIGLNRFPSVTLEAYVYTGVNDSYTMLAYFGGLQSSNSLWMQLTRPDDQSRFELNTNGAMTNVNGLEPAPMENHHYVGVATNDSLYWYIDGMLVNKVATQENNIIASINPANAWLCYGGWNDPTWLGSLYEFNIYSGAMNAQTVAMRSVNFPFDDATTDATLSDLRVDGTTIDNFASYRLAYEVLLETGTVDVPAVEATEKVAGASAEVTDAEGIPGVTTILVTAADGETTNTYTVNFVLAVSNDATLSDLAVDGTTVEGFAPGTFTYNVVLPYGTITVPTVTATAAHANAAVEITNAPTLPGATTVRVTAEDGVTTLTYTINFSVEVSVPTAGKSEIKVYPTVSGGYFTVRTDGDPVTITVYNLAGVPVSKTVTHDAETVVTTPGPGLYILRVEGRDSVETFRIIHAK